MGRAVTATANEALSQTTISATTAASLTVKQAAASANYWLFWSSWLRAGSNVTEDVFGNVQMAGATIGAVNIEQQATSPAQQIPFVGFARYAFTSSATQNFTLQVRAEGTQSAGADQVFLCAIAGDAGDSFTETTSESSLSAATITAVELNFTAATSGPHLCATYFEWDRTITGTVAATVTWPDGEAMAFAGRHRDDTNWLAWFHGRVLSLTSGSAYTLKVTSFMTAGVGGIRNRRAGVIALPTGFGAVTFGEASASASLTNTTAYVTFHSLSASVPAGRHLIFGSAPWRAQSSSVGIYFQFLLDGASRTEFVMTPYVSLSTSIGFPAMLMEARSLTAGTHNIEWQGRTDTTAAVVRASYRPNLAIIAISEGGATTNTLTGSIDGVIQRQGIAVTASIDAKLQKTLSLVASLDATIIRQIALSGQIDAIIKKTLSAVASIDAKLLKTMTASAQIDAKIARLQNLSAQIDALLGKQFASTASIDATIKKTLSATANLDAKVQHALSLTAELHAVILRTLTASAAIDAILTRGASPTLTALIDAIVARSVGLTAELDAIIYRRQTLAAAIDAILLANWAQQAETSGSWANISESVGGWSPIAEAAGGWSTLSETTAGWQTLSETTNVWTH